MVRVEANGITAGNLDKVSYRVKGEPVSMTLGCCSRLDCPEQVVTTLGEKVFCFDHFCSQCYELLERQQRSADYACSSAEYWEEISRLDECSRRALEISFSGAELNNLDRARLLDILLWAGDLSSEMRRRRATMAETAERTRLSFAMASSNGTKEKGSRNRANLCRFLKAFH